MENYEKLYKETLERARDLHDNHPLGQPQTWSTCEKIFPELKESEDERIRKSLITFFQRFPYDSLEKAGTNVKEAIVWLEKQSEQKSWSEEDEEILNNIITAFKRIGENCEHYFSPDTAKVFEKTLKSLKDRVQPQPKQEWSEEDEKMKSLIISTLTSMGTLNLERYHHMNLDEVKNWLKSIKPQSHWKPSEEQIKSLRIALQTMPYSKDKENVLIILEQLVKL